MIRKTIKKDPEIMESAKHQLEQNISLGRELANTLFNKLRNQYIDKKYWFKINSINIYTDPTLHKLKRFGIYAWLDIEDFAGVRSIASECSEELPDSIIKNNSVYEQYHLNTINEFYNCLFEKLIGEKLC